MSMDSRTEFRVEGLPAPLSHYTDAVRWGDLVFISGCAAIDETGQVAAPGDVAGQARVVHEYLGRALAAAGSDFAHVLKVTVFLTNIADRGIVNEVRKEFFGAARPASTLIEVSALAIDGLLVEIEAVAGIPACRTAVAKALEILKPEENITDKNSIPFCSIERIRGVFDNTVYRIRGCCKIFINNGTRDNLVSRAAAGNVRPASSRRRPRARPRRWSVAVAGVRWSGPGSGSIAVVLVARWRLGVVMRGICRAWSGLA